MRTLLDANAVLRHLLDDIPEQAEAATYAIEDGAEVTPEVVAECVYVLAGPYELKRATISDALTALLAEVECERHAIIEEGLRIFAKTKLDFVDCLLVAANRIIGQPVLTFDKKLNKLLEAASE